MVWWGSWGLWLSFRGVSDGALLGFLEGLAVILAGLVGVLGDVMQANRHILEVFGGRLEQALAVVLNTQNGIF